MISFLAWWDPSTWLDTNNDIVGLIIQGIRSLCFYICTLIYDLIIKLYYLFDILCRGRLLDNDIMKELSSRIGLILGIMMFFIVSISFIKLLIDPDSITDKTKGASNIIMKVIVVIVCLGFSNFIFNGLYKIQNVVVENHVISKILLPYEIEMNEFGETLSARLFLSFYKIHDTFLDQIDVDGPVKDCNIKTMTMAIRIRKFRSFDMGYVCLNESAIPNNNQAGEPNQKVFIIDFNWFLAILVGVVVAYFLFSYAVTIGVRMIQLAFLEIISPMAIVSHLMPTNDTPFNKWIKLYVSTYVDVFIKIAIINFIVFLIAIMFENGESWTFWQTVNASDDMINFVMVAMILALLTFAKKVPDLINKILPTGDSGLGSKGFSFKDIMGGNLIKKGVNMAARTATVGAAIATTGALTSGISRYKMNMKNGKTSGEAMAGAIGGAFMAFGRGLKVGAFSKGNGFKSISEGIKSQRTVDDKYDQLIASGGTTMGVFKSKLTSFFGETKGQTYTRHVNNMDQVEKYKKDIQAFADEFICVKAAKDAWQNIVQWKGESLEDYKKRKQRAYDEYRLLRNGAIEAAYKGEEDFVVEHKDENGNVIFKLNGNIKTADDPLYAADITNKIKEFNNYVSSHVVQYWDDNKKDYITAKDFMIPDFDPKKPDAVNVSALLNENSQLAHKTRTKIIAEPDYSAAIADDANAGVNSNATSNKK